MFTIYSVDKTDKEPNLSLSVAFMISSIYAVIIFGGIPIKKRIDTFSKGAGASNLMLMLWIYVLAGAFVTSAKSTRGNIKPLINSNQIALNVGIGYRIEVSDNFSILLDYQSQSGLTNIAKASGVNLRNTTGSFNIGGVILL